MVLKTTLITLCFNLTDDIQIDILEFVTGGHGRTSSLSLRGVPTLVNYPIVLSTYSFTSQFLKQFFESV